MLDSMAMDWKDVSMGLYPLPISPISATTSTAFSGLDAAAINKAAEDLASLSAWDLRLVLFWKGFLGREWVLVECMVWVVG